MDYDELRRLAIDAKRSILHEAGIGSDAVAEDLRRTAADRKRKQRPKKGRKRKRVATDTEDDDDFVPSEFNTRRRSTRIRSGGRKSYAEADGSDEDNQEYPDTGRARKRQRMGPLEVSSGDGALPTAAEAAKIVAASETGARQDGSSRDLDADVDRLLRDWLGKQIPYHLGGAGKQAKRAAMQTTCASSTRVRFSRMSGIQQWRNAVCLFVNVGGEEYYENAFSGRMLEGFRGLAGGPPGAAKGGAESSAAASSGAQAGSAPKGESSSDGVFVQWFAQRTQHPKSPVILRILAGFDGAGLGQQAEDAGSARPDEGKGGGEEGSGAGAGEADALLPCPVCMFCRLPGEPYVFCGRLRVASVDLERRPMQFEFQLLDAGEASMRGSKQFARILFPPELEK